MMNFLPQILQVYFKNYYLQILTKTYFFYQLLIFIESHFVSLYRINSVSCFTHLSSLARNNISMYNFNHEKFVIVKK